ncbi:5-formyltetrahydrofolate cyclo-ligase [Streptomyces sp. enrichment culture]|uniref:5-formyltetrahydrofolate cyclo-ligase n=1 Tax=Streptomyces sp. enrichment culture TaxID=1795815 RepID=UPI003F55754D
MNRIREVKQSIRERVWASLDRQKITPQGATGRIPNFIGAGSAAAILAEHEAWQAASVVKAVPDRAQLAVRARALEEGKRLYMAASKLAAAKPFYLLDPATLTIPLHDAAERRTAARFAQPVDVDDMDPVDLVICGSVAVNYEGVRLGKGAGYSDIELALLQEAGLIGPNTLIATTVHELQVMNEEIPEGDHDFRVDLIITQDRVIECPRYRRPPGILWEFLTPEMISAIPTLAKRNRTAEH